MDRVILAADIGGTAIKSALVQGERMWDHREIPSPGREGGAALMARLLRLLDEYGGYDRIGISTAGQVDAATGAITYANENIPGYTGTELAKIVSAHTGKGTVVENDVFCAAIGEYHYGAAKGLGDFICLTYGTGVGGAIVIGGGIYRGGGAAGELGHIVTHQGGRPCACGGTGCYEQYASASALVREARKLDESLDNGRAVFEALGRECPQSAALQKLVDAWIGEIACGLVSLIHVFHPSCVVLGGGILEEMSLIGRIRDSMRSGLMPAYRDTPLFRAALGNRAGLLGASRLADSSGL